MKQFMAALKTTISRLAIASAVLILSACSQSGNSSDMAVTTRAFLAPTPDSDTFYAAPAQIPNVLGTILNSREITFQPGGVALPNPAWQLQYVTRDGHGRPIAAVTTVVKPIVPNTYGHPVLVSFQHAYDSLGADCTPSKTAQGSTANSTNLAETLEYLPGLQTLGWTLVIPDYEGPEHAFGAGRLSGQATLDAVRAALRFEPLGLSAETPAGLWGYSGGAYATTWAAALHPSYASELLLAGVVAGGTPVDILGLIPAAEHTDSFSLLLGLIFGATRDYPDLLPYSLLNDKGRKAIAALKDSCEGVATDGQTVTGGALADYTTAAMPYDTAGFQAVRPQLNVLHSGLHPIADVYLYHEIDDALVPIAGADELAQRWCAEGTPLSYYRSTAGVVGGFTPVGTHTAGAAIGTPNAIDYFNGRFIGSPVPVTPVGTQRCAATA